MSTTFHYQARTTAGARVAGVMRAPDRRAALGALRERLLLPVALEPLAASTGLARLLFRGNARERLAFFRAYASLEHAGVDFSTAFDLLVGQARSESFRDALHAIRSAVEQHGEKLWAAMSHRPRDFSDLEVAMVAAGEESGHRERVFDNLAEFLERDERLRKRLHGILLYPAIVLGGAAVMLAYLVYAVVPQFVGLFAAFDVAPSPLVSALARVTTVARSPWFWPAFAALPAFLAFLALRFARSSDGALILDRLRLRLPLFGPLIKKISVARLVRVLATLLESGVHQVRALDVARPVVESPVLALAVERARERIVSGTSASLDEAFAADGAFDALLLGFMRVGARAGDVPQMLARVADYYEDEAQSILAILPQLFQTAATLVLGALVAAIVYVVYVPLSTLSSSIH
jgi:type IV pilus assembly protein PilC